MTGGEAGERLRRAFCPAFAGRRRRRRAGGGLGDAARLYRRRADLPDPAGGAATVPAGSRLQVALSGGAARAGIAADGEAAAFRALDGASFAAERALDEGARLAVRRGGAELARWALTVQADAPPPSPSPSRRRRRRAASAPACPGRPRMTGAWPRCAPSCGWRRGRTRRRWWSTCRCPAAARSARGAAQPDLSAHPWAGLEVAPAAARDGAGQEGAAEAAG